MVVYKLLPGDKEEKIYDAPVRTDAKGRAFWTWPSDEAGHYRIAYEATDAWGEKIIGSTEIWVNGPGLSETQFRLQGVNDCSRQAQLRRRRNHQSAARGRSARYDGSLHAGSGRPDSAPRCHQH
jgi:hypothetical protein